MVLTRINHNIAALNAHRTLSGNSKQLSKSLERLSSGLRINRASDDAAGLSISEILRRQINGSGQAVNNANNAINLINTSEAALDETTALLQRVRQLAVQAANEGANNKDMLLAIQSEIEALTAEVTRIGTHTQFAARNLLNGDYQASAKMLSQGGITIPSGPVNSTLPTGRHYLDIVQIDPGSALLLNGADGVNNSGIHNIIGSSFATGQYRVEVSEARAAAERVQQSGLFDAGGPPINTTDLVTGVSFTGSDGNTVVLEAGDLFTITGQEADGIAIASLPPLVVAAGTTVQDIVDHVQAHYTTATATWDNVNNRLVLTDNATGVSKTELNINVTDVSNPVNSSLDNAIVVVEGNFNDANVRIGGGDPVNVIAGETRVIYGPQPRNENEPRPEVQVTFGALSDGVDIFQTIQAQYSGRLDGGEAVRFQNGDQAVRFRTGDAAGFTSGDKITVNFDAQIDLLGGTSRTFVIEAENNALLFQVGPNAEQDVFVPIGDLRAENLGFVGEKQAHNGYPRTVAGIDVTSFDGAQEAIRICDIAISQITDQRSALGALSNRLESTVASLDVAKENLSSAETRIRDTDIAEETTTFTRNQILVQAGVSVLAQANLVPQSVLSLLQ